MTAEGLYPLSTQDGRAIPLEVVKPKSLVSYGILAGVSANIVVPDDYSLCYAYSDVSCILRFSATDLPASLVAGTAYDNTIFIPASTPVTLIATPGEASILGLADAGTLYLTSVQQWAAMLQSRQTNIG